MNELISCWYDKKPVLVTHYSNIIAIDHLSTCIRVYYHDGNNNCQCVDCNNITFKDK